MGAGTGRFFFETLPVRLTSLVQHWGATRPQSTRRFTDTVGPTTQAMAFVLIGLVLLLVINFAGR